MRILNISKSPTHIMLYVYSLILFCSIICWYFHNVYSYKLVLRKFWKTKLIPLSANTTRCKPRSIWNDFPSAMTYHCFQISRNNHVLIPLSCSLKIDRNEINTVTHRTFGRYFVITVIYQYNISISVISSGDIQRVFRNIASRTIVTRLPLDNRYDDNDNLRDILLWLRVTTQYCTTAPYNFNKLFSHLHVSAVVSIRTRIVLNN